LEKWSGVQSKGYHLVLKNQFGMKVVDFQFAVNYMFNGRYSNGAIKEKGRYLTHLTIAPRQLSVTWGFFLKAKVEIPTIVNAGTKENPKARAIINLHLNFGSAIKEEKMLLTFQIDGDGAFTRIN
jgi:hypothetical protein